MGLYFSDGAKVEAYDTFLRSGILDDYEQFEVDRAHSKVILKGFNRKAMKHVKLELPVLYRTDEKYKNRLLAKLYKLNDWYLNQPCTKKYTTMITLTSKQKGMSYMQQYNFIQECYRQWRKDMKKHYPNLSYVLIGEPHKTGYLHYHVLTFSDFSDKEQEHIKQLYYATGAGNERSIQIDVSKAGVRSAKNYLMKYISKTISVEPSEDKIEGSDLNRFEGQEEVLHFHLFNAILWKLNKHNNDFKGVRVFQASHDISKVMKLDLKAKNENIDWYEVTMKIWGETYLIHEIVDFNLPDIPDSSFELLT